MPKYKLTRGEIFTFSLPEGRCAPLPPPPVTPLARSVGVVHGKICDFCHIFALAQVTFIQSTVKVNQFPLCVCYVPVMLFKAIRVVILFIYRDVHMSSCNLKIEHTARELNFGNIKLCRV